MSREAAKTNTRGPKPGQGGRPKVSIPVSQRPSWPKIMETMEEKKCSPGQALDLLLGSQIINKDQESS